MAVFRVEKTKNYTVMANHHLQNTKLSLKAKGLLSVMLSVPDTWEHSIAGYASICKDGVDGITSTIKELEKNGYITRCRLRNEKGHLTNTEYTIYEYPKVPVLEKPKEEKPTLENPVLDKPILDEPVLENPPQYNTNLSNKKEWRWQKPNPLGFGMKFFLLSALSSITVPSGTPQSSALLEKRIFIPKLLASSAKNKSRIFGASD